MIGIVVIILFALFAVGVPIAYTLGLTGIFAMYMVGGTSLAVVPMMMFSGANAYTLVAIPLFMLMGEIMNKSGISNRLIDFASSIIGFIRGGLGIATVMTGTVMAAISGSATADAAALGSILIPQMEKRGYKKGFAASIVSSGATLASMIPPSINMILYAVIAGCSISQLFIAGVIPGLIMSGSFMLLVYFFARKEGMTPEGKFQLHLVGKAFWRAIWGLVLPIIVIGGILLGYFTPTEAGAIGVVYSLLVGMFVYREFKVVDLVPCLKGAARQTSIVMLMVATSSILGWFISQQRIPQNLATSMLSISENPYVIMAMAVIVILIAGMFLQASPLIVMILPILTPMVESVGWDLIQFGVIACIALCIGQVSPPVASVLMTTMGIANCNLDKVLPYILPVMGVMLIVLILVVVLPPLALWLPSVMISSV